MTKKVHIKKLKSGIETTKTKGLKRTIIELEPLDGETDKALLVRTKKTEGKINLCFFRTFVEIFIKDLKLRKEIEQILGKDGFRTRENDGFLVVRVNSELTKNNIIKAMERYMKSANAL